MAAAAPASVSPPGQGKLLPGLVGAALSEPFCLRCRQPPCPERGPRSPRPSAEVPPLLADGLGEQIAARPYRRSKSQAAAPSSEQRPAPPRPPSPGTLRPAAPWRQPGPSSAAGKRGRHRADREPAPRAPAEQPPGSWEPQAEHPRQVRPLPSAPSRHGGTLGPQRRATRGPLEPRISLGSGEGQEPLAVRRVRASRTLCLKGWDRAPSKPRSRGARPPPSRRGWSLPQAPPALPSARPSTTGSVAAGSRRSLPPASALPKADPDTPSAVPPPAPPCQLRGRGSLPL